MSAREQVVVRVWINTGEKESAIMSINGLSVPLHQVHISRKEGVVSFRAEARRGTIIENAERKD